MTAFSVALELFHFLRPWFLLLLLPLALIWWRIRHLMARPRFPEGALAPHLSRALTLDGSGTSGLRPIDGVALALALAITGAAGPTWSRLPDPFMAQTAPLVIALHVSPSMEASDVLPSRLERARQKIRDLLDLRAGARTALIAYAGTAHPVVPMTGDPQVMLPYLEGLAPDVMPREGNDAGAALDLAQRILSREEMPGGVLFLTDALTATDAERLNAATKDTTEGVTAPVALAVLGMLPETAGDAGLEALGGRRILLSADDSDIRSLDRRLNAAFQRAQAATGSQPWRDRGWLLAWPAALLALMWFRRGWTMRWRAGLWLAPLAALMLIPAPPARAANPAGLWAQLGTEITGWFLTPDQQGELAARHHDYARAAELYADPMRRGYALYRSGRYEEATSLLAGLDSPEASFLQGMAFLRSRGYREAIRAFETTLKRDPAFPGAAHNLDLARKILDYVEMAREQSDTGEDQGIGADDVVTDNEEGRGADTQTEAPREGATPLTADQWMTTVDSAPGDFLRQRFAIEATRNAAAARGSQ